ncbi:MAG: hypothetical protein GC205_07455 [Bacteroidetes bacterium]|nr:hypothetical protein [Bacteroidota bacterium]
MKRLFDIVLIVVLLCFGRVVHSQGHAANWVFGDGFHIEFDEAGPNVLPFIENYYAFEGASSISTKTGELLFYSNTINIWNREFAPLFNSDTLPYTGLIPTTTKSNGSLLLPWPGDSLDRYFAFYTMDEAESKIRLSQIDRYLDMGLGGIVDSFKYKDIFGVGVAEQMTAVRHANGRDWWIICRKGQIESNEFIVALHTPLGIDHWELQDAGFLAGFAGELVSSKDGSFLALTAIGICPEVPSMIGLFSFDRCEGRVQFIDSILTQSCAEGPYGIVFSADGLSLFYSTIKRVRVYQLRLVDDVLVDSLMFTIPGSAFLVESGSLERGKDDEVYISYRLVNTISGLMGVSNHLGKIYMNEFGDYLFDTLFLPLNGRENPTFSLPNFANYDLGPLVGSPCDTLSPQDTTKTGFQSSPLQNISWSVDPSISSGNYTVTGGSGRWLVVHDLYGREVLRLWHEGTTPFDLTTQPAGLYLVHLRGVDGTRSLPQKIVRQ